MPWPEFDPRPLSRPQTEFLSGAWSRVWAAGQVELVAVDFEPAQFETGLFNRLKVDFPAEIRRSVRNRQAEFLAGRVAARLCLAQCGFSENAIPQIPIGRHRAPVWPRGIVGAITHTGTRAWCALCPRSSASGVGIDLEALIEPERAASVARQIHDSAELGVAQRNGLSANAATTLIFSAKESLFKALYPTVGEYFGFECARLTELSPGDGSLRLQLDPAFSRRHRLREVHACRFALDQARALTMVIAPAPPR